MSEWIACSDRNPPVDTPVLAWDTQRIYIARRPSEDPTSEHWTVCDGDCACNGCTGAIVKWMFIPPDPDQETQSDETQGDEVDEDDEPSSFDCSWEGLIWRQYEYNKRVQAMINKDNPEHSVSLNRSKESLEIEFKDES